MYNLTSKQREILQWIIQNVRDGNLEEEFTFVRVASGDILFIGRGARNVLKPVPDLSTGALRALMQSGLILVDTANNNVHCTLLGKAYEAVDSEF